jgi:hypothetical protein
VAVLVAAVVYALLPQSLLLGPRFAIPIIELALLAALIATNPRRMVRQSRWSRIAASALAGLVIVVNLTALAMLIARLVASNASGGSLLLGAAMQVWITNVIGFGLLFWELDRRGPVARRKLPAKSCRGGLAIFPGQERRHRDRSRGRLEQDVRLGPNICRLPLCVPDLLQRLQSDRHNAPSRVAPRG